MLHGGPAGWDDAQRAELVALLPRLRAFARSLEPRAAAADDLLHDAVTRALSSSPPPAEGLRPWLFTVLRNHFLNTMRRRRVEARAAERMGPPPEAAGGGAEEAVAARELMAALARLPAAQREALVLVGAQGFTYEEAAGITATPVGTVKARVARGRAALAQLMAPRAPGAPARPMLEDE